MINDEKKSRQMSTQQKKIKMQFTFEVLVCEPGSMCLL